VAIFIKNEVSFMYAYFAVLLALCAGVINGSFSVPSKHINQWSFENTWLSYAIWAFLILPLLTTVIFHTNIFHLYGSMPSKLLWIMIIGGLLFGLGQIGLAIAIDTIGIGLTFTIAIGLSTGLGFLLPLLFQHAEAILTPFGLFTLIGVALSLLGLILSTTAGNHRNKTKSEAKAEELVRKVSSHARSTFFLGILLAMIAGLFSAGQNFTFSLTRPMQTFALAAHVNPLWAANIVWPGFLLAALVPYGLYMIYRQIKHKTFALYKKPITPYYIILTLIMGAFWFFSLLVYGKSAQMIGGLGPIVGWPVFMIFIILTSNFWGWIYGEWKGCGKVAARLLRLSLLFLIAAFILLGISVRFQTTVRSHAQHQPAYKNLLTSIVKSTRRG
jgi:L-rhamnose-proton symport protein (RhaT)